MLKSLLYRLKGIKEIEVLEEKIIFECIKCQNRLTVYKNYGKLRVVCKCGHFCNVYTGPNTQALKRKDLDIPRELKVFDFLISEYQGRLILRGKYLNQSVYYLKDSFGNFSVGESDKEILFFPSLNIQKSNSPKIIEPFEEGEFCHYLSEEEASSINKKDFTSFKIRFVEFTKSRKRD